MLVKTYSFLTCHEPTLPKA